MKKQKQSRRRTLWSTEECGNKIGRITPDNNGIPSHGRLLATHPVRLFCNPGSITAGADGNLWFADSLNNRIWKMNTDGVIIGDYLVDSCPGFAGFGPHGITAGPDGAVWFAHLDCNYIGRIATGTKQRPALAANYFLTAIEGCPILAFLPDRSTNSTARCT